MSVGSLVFSGPMLLAVPVAAAAGAVTFLSPCVLPLVPGYLSYITGMSGASAEDGTDEAGGRAAGSPAAGTHAESVAVARAGSQTVAVAAPVTAVAATSAMRAPRQPSRRRALAAAALFVLGFSALFATYGVAFGSIGSTLLGHRRGLDEVLGSLLIVLGLLFAGTFDRFSFSGRIVKPSLRPKAGLASAPLIGVLFGLGWTPCSGPTLSAVLTLGASSGTAAKGALLAFVYALGIGVPFLMVAFAVDRGVAMFGFARRHARAITRIGGLLLIVVGLLEVTGAWSSAMSWLQVHWGTWYTPPI
jgi:cytochrome c-type biogenesis protein